MALTDLKFTNADFNDKKIADLSDNPSSDGMTAAALKAYFDVIPVTMVALGAINQIIDALAADSGASEIGASVTGLSSVNVQGLLEELEEIASDHTTDINGLVKSVTYDSTTGNFTITKFDDSTSVIQTELEKVVTNFTYDASTQSLILTYPDGTTSSIPLSDFITEFEFENSSSIEFTVANHKVTASLSSTYLSTLQGYVAQAEGYKNNAYSYMNSAEGYKDTASQKASEASSSATSAGNSATSANADKLKSEGFAVGEQNGVPVDPTSPYYHNNAKYYKERAEEASGAVTSVNRQTGEVMLDADDIPESATRKYVSTTEKNKWNNKLDKSGGTMTGDLFLAHDPTQDSEAATKKYVDEHAPSKQLVSIEVDTQPNKTKYQVGELIDLTGIKVIANFDDQTYRDVTEYCVYSPAQGTAVTAGMSSISITYQGTATSQSIGLIHVYGIQRDITNSNPAWTRTDEAVGKTFSASVGSTAGHSDFDSCMPWSGMVRETIGSDVMVKIPKFWYKRWLDGNIEHIQIADGAATGFSVHPMFYYGSTECDHIYVGAYHTASGYVSQTGKAPLANIKRSDARTGSKNKGAGWSQLDFSANAGIQMLILVETANNNVQATIGKGYSNSSNTVAINSGSCDSVANLTGRPSGTDDRVGAVYRGIENLWGNIWQWVDGINMNGATPYICLDPSKYADDTATNYEQLSYGIGSTSYSSSYISQEGYDSNHPFAMMPTQASGSETTFYCDAIWSATGWRVCPRGGMWNYAGMCGLFTVSVNFVSSFAGSHSGARLLYRPI